MTQEETPKKDDGYTNNPKEVKTQKTNFKRIEKTSLIGDRERFFDLGYEKGLKRGIKIGRDEVCINCNCKRDQHFCWRKENTKFQSKEAKK